MNTFLHITSGDVAGSSLAASGVPGELLVWHDVLYDGPRQPGWPDAATLLARAAFLERHTGGGLHRDHIEKTLRLQYTRLREAAGTHSLVLWFDACLFDQSMLAHLLACLHGLAAPQVELLCVDAFPGIVPYDGLGQLAPPQLAACFPNRRPVTPAQSLYAVRVDQALAVQDKALLAELAGGDGAPLPWVPAALRRWLAEAPDPDTGLGRLEQLALDSVRAGCRRPAAIFTATAADDVHPQYWGDTTLWEKLNGMAERHPPLVSIHGPTPRLPQWPGQGDLSLYEVVAVPSDAAADAADDIMAELEGRLQRAAADTPRRRPWLPADREDIRRIAAECLGIREDRIPRIVIRHAAELQADHCRVVLLQATSWDRCVATAHLYLPETDAAAPLPLIILCCGHGKGGKQSPGYQRVAWRLARLGAAVLVPDNIGQGERTPMGHRAVLGPFQCGLSLQGMIVMETIAWLRWARNDGRFDTGRIAAIGNSGGGTLTVFLAAFCREELAALSSSGYPSTFAFVAAKEKWHCHCNILPGVVGRIDMWHLYGSFAPKPLFLFQGQNDNLFPEELFYRVTRKVADVYRRAGAASAFAARVFPGEHSWDDARGQALGGFLSRTLGLNGANPSMDEFRNPPGDCFATWPDDALSTDAVACRLTGSVGQPCGQLFEVYRPDLAAVEDVPFRRVGLRQLAAQMEAFLARPREASSARHG